MAALEYHRTNLDRNFFYDNCIKQRLSRTKVLKLPREKNSANIQPADSHDKYLKKTDASETDFASIITDLILNCGTKYYIVPKV